MIDAQGSLTIEQGPYVEPIRFATQNADGTLTPLDLTGALVQMQVRRRKGDETVVIDVDTATKGGITITDALDGWIEVRISDGNVAELPSPLSGVYDVLVNRERWLEGTVTIDLGVTK